MALWNRSASKGARGTDSFTPPLENASRPTSRRREPWAAPAWKAFSCSARAASARAAMSILGAGRPFRSLTESFMLPEVS